jgi:hypothetical protein
LKGTPSSDRRRRTYRCLSLADLASAVLAGTPHRSSGRLALHVPQVLFGILEAAATRRPVEITTPIERPAALTDAAAHAFAQPGAAI